MAMWIGEHVQEKWTGEIMMEVRFRQCERFCVVMAQAMASGKKIDWIKSFERWEKVELDLAIDKLDGRIEGVGVVVEYKGAHARFYAEFREGMRNKVKTYFKRLKGHVLEGKGLGYFFVFDSTGDD